jgi:hypothetical protein
MGLVPGMMNPVAGMESPGAVFAEGGLRIVVHVAAEHHTEIAVQVEHHTEAVVQAGHHIEVAAHAEAEHHIEVADHIEAAARIEAVGHIEVDHHAGAAHHNPEIEPAGSSFRPWYRSWNQWRRVTVSRSIDQA